MTLNTLLPWSLTTTQLQAAAALSLTLPRWHGPSRVFPSRQDVTHTSTEPDKARVSTYVMVLHPAYRQDETILPTDYKTAGQIVDDELNELLVKPLLPGVTLHALIDACHSGTAMDLPYRVKASKSGRMDWKVRGGTRGTCTDNQHGMSA